ncbi:MAG: flagellar motor switch protein FliG, partial [Nitrospinae bacterium]|nr:flagellar motor switch protein FliG [Nitrospinota bacterium]
MARIFTGPEKASILLMSLGEEMASKVMSNLDEREIQSLGNYMSTI